MESCPKNKKRRRGVSQSGVGIEGDRIEEVHSQEWGGKDAHKRIKKKMINKDEEGR